MPIGALAGDHVRIVERVHVNQIALALELHGVLDRAVVARPRAGRLHRPSAFTAWTLMSGVRWSAHDDDRGNAPLAGSERYP